MTWKNIVSVVESIVFDYLIYNSYSENQTHEQTFLIGFTAFRWVIKNNPTATAKNHRH